jgi:hypothetical protein
MTLIISRIPQAAKNQDTTQFPLSPALEVLSPSTTDETPLVVQEEHWATTTAQQPTT